MTDHRDPDRLLASQILLADTGEHLPVDERRVTAAMLPSWRVDLNDPISTRAGLVGGILTGLGFVLPAERLVEVLASDPPELPELPPLPFRRCVFEVQKDGEPVPLAQYEEGGEGEPLGRPAHDESPFLSLQIAVVFEREQGHEWDVVLALRVRQEGDPRLVNASVAMRIHDEEVELPGNMNPESSRFAGEEVRRIVLLCAHLVTARGVPLRPLLHPRPTRRRFKRRWARETPTAYYVDLDAAAQEYGTGAGERVYRHRWIVRGHWRHLRSGDRTWVRAYVKGPAGAPWMGRPVHVSAS